MKETVEEFLARGGAIKVIPKGVSAFDHKKFTKQIQYSRTIQYEVDKKSRYHQSIYGIKEQ